MVHGHAPNTWTNARCVIVFGSGAWLQGRDFKERLRKACIGGIPPELRGHIWWLCAGGAQKKASAKADEQ